MIVAVDFNGSEDDDCQGVLTVSLCGDDVECIKMFLRAISVSRRVLEANFRPICHPIRNRGQYVRSICLVGLFKQGGTSNPNGHVPLGRFTRDVSLLLQRLLKIVRRFVLGVFQWSGNDDVGHAYRAATSNFVAANFCRFFIWPKWRRHFFCLAQRVWSVGQG